MSKGVVITKNPSTPDPITEVQGKGKWIMGQEEVTKSQEMLDAELALKLQEEERNEMLKRLTKQGEERMESEKLIKQLEEEDRQKAILEKKKATSKKVVTKHTKDTEDRKKFMDFLKTCGYNGKQLGPMKFQNLL